MNVKLGTTYNNMEICQACLRTGDYVQPMSVEDLKRYRLFITKVEDPLIIMYICIYCKSILRRIVKFIEQCRLSDVFIKEAFSKDPEVLSKVRVDHLGTSKTTYNYVGPNNDEDEIPLVLLNHSNHAEDDIPLVLLNQSNDEDCNDYQEPLDNKIEVKKEDFDDLDDVIPNGGTKKTKKKQVKEGFTSRMVTETNEYVVIKLTKEQILEEMKEHSNSEKYKILPYKCEKCVRGFNFEDVLQSHMEKHSPSNGPFQCEICEQFCPSKVSLRGHMKSHSTRYKCKLCDLIRLSRQHILEHYSLEHTDSAALYRCPKCPHTTNKRTVMQRHVRLHSTSEPLKCKLCGKFYKSKESLRVHTMRHDGKKLHQCDICTSSFVYATQLTKHMQSVHERKDYYCVECDIMFKSMDNLKQHLKRAKRHRDASSYKHACPQCEQRFASAATLATHGAAAHGADKPARCGECARRYSSADALRGHTRRAHAPPPRALPCPLCARVFSRKYVLRVHMRTHTGERPHTCPCGAAFAQASALRAHCAAKHKLVAYTEAAKAAIEERAARLRNRAPSVTDEMPKTSAALDTKVQQVLDVFQVADKSGNLKGTFVRALKTAADSIKGAVADLRALTMSEEVARLEVANAKLSGQLAELRREVAQMRQKPAELSDSNELKRIMEETLRCSREQFSTMLNARMEGIKRRLLPEPRLRPSLAAVRKAAQNAAASARVTAPAEPTTTLSGNVAKNVGSTTATQRKKKAKRPTMAAQEAPPRQLRSRAVLVLAVVRQRPNKPPKKAVEPSTKPAKVETPKTVPAKEKEGLAKDFALLAPRGDAARGDAWLMGCSVATAILVRVPADTLDELRKAYPGTGGTT
ncbi:zinc finger and BTB domain-containing protein 11-like [Vanessa cardui]|uniref:zinc finger and BTB domain-containing protein 11-like n=1 Tax=Vanessa cardui TaxID=171605 RepID=UPI001F139F28|nr:zinc finger and BTB domain-containing protein 11-like [Vanessa cardui]